jgi:hypothetical protein
MQSRKVNAPLHRLSSRHRARPPSTPDMKRHLPYLWHLDLCSRASRMAICCAMLSAQYVRFDAKHGRVSCFGYYTRLECHCSRLQPPARNSPILTLQQPHRLHKVRRAASEEAFRYTVDQPLRKGFEGKCRAMWYLLGSCSAVPRRLATHIGEHIPLDSAAIPFTCRMYTCRGIWLRRVIDSAFLWKGTYVMYLQHATRPTTSLLRRASCSLVLMITELREDMTIALHTQPDKDGSNITLDGKYAPCLTHWDHHEDECCRYIIQTSARCLV